MQLLGELTDVTIVTIVPIVTNNHCAWPSVSFLMEKVDLVMVGAEGVAESGGIINKVGVVV